MNVHQVCQGTDMGLLQHSRVFDCACPGRQGAWQPMEQQGALREPAWGARQAART